MEPYARTNPEADKHEEAQQQPQLSATATTAFRTSDHAQQPPQLSAPATSTAAAPES